MITSTSLDTVTLTKHASCDEDVKQSVSIASVVQSRPCDIEKLGYSIQVAACFIEARNNCVSKNCWLKLLLFI